MSAPTNHWKLGLFVVVSFLVGLSAMVYVGAKAMHKETVSYRSYFDEGVSGLEIGSRVTFRGVTLGNVSAIDVAPDRRHVEISYELGVDELARLGLANQGGQATQIKVPPDLRVQLGSNGITGNKFLQIDFFPVASNPLPRLPFPVPKNYIPATSSTMKSVEDALVRAADAIPRLAEEMTLILGQVSGLLREVQTERLPAKAGVTLESANRLFAVLDQKVSALEVKEMSAEGRAALTKLNAILAEAQAMLADMQGQRGLMVSLTRASNNIGDLAENARDLGPEMSRALADVEGAARGLRELVLTLKRDPDMLVKGRAEVDE